MSLNIFCKPRLLINNKEVAVCNSANFQCSESALQSFSASITDPDFDNVNLFNEKIEFYLNYGSEDGVPLFRGYIKSFNTSPTGLTLSAVDPRGIITGKEALPVVIDDKNNYDGSTIVQFLIDVIENEVNINETLISTEGLSEMDKPVYMNDIRSVQAPYDIAKGLIETQRDADNLLTVFEYYFDILHGGKDSSLTIKKTKNLTESADFIYSERDGIISINYTERAPPSFAIIQAEDGTSVRADYGNAPRGNRGIVVSTRKAGTTKNKTSSRAEAREQAMAEILLKQNDDKDITMQVSKGYYIDIGSIIRIESTDANIVGQYRLTSKSISFSQSSVTCSFNLNKKPLQIKDYLPL